MGKNEKIQDKAVSKEKIFKILRKKVDKKVVEYFKLIERKNDLSIEIDKIKDSLSKFIEMYPNLNHPDVFIEEKEGRTSPKYKELSFYLLTEYITENLQNEFLKEIQENTYKKLDDKKLKEITLRFKDAWDASHPKKTSNSLKINKPK